MLVDPNNIDFEMVEIDGVKVLFTDCRLDKTNIPNELYCYDLREGEGFSNYPCSIEERVFVNYFGAIISKQPFSLKGGYYALSMDSLEYLGYKIKLQDYANS